VFGALTAERIGLWLSGKTESWAKLTARFLQPAAMVLCVANCVAMMYAVPLVLKEGIVNAATRVPFEHQLSVVLDEIPRDVPVMMSTSAHVGAVQVAGRSLKSMVSEGDDQSWQIALKDPAANAAYVISMVGDPVEAAVKAHPEGLTELEVICSRGQPCARVYQSKVWVPQATH